MKKPFLCLVAIAAMFSTEAVHAQAQCVATHNDYGDINSIAFSPASSWVMYFGLESEQGVH